MTTAASPRVAPVAPGPPGATLLGNLPALRRDRIRVFLDAADTYGDVVRFQFGPGPARTAHLLRHPDHIKHVFVDAADRFTKQTPGVREVRALLGDGLLTSEGALWKRQRRIAQPAFQKQRIAAFAGVMVRAAGHETTANALAWTFYLLSTHPDVRRSARAEIGRVTEGRLPDFQDLGALDLVGRVFQESMRLYPPAWMISRRAADDDVIGGYSIPGGSLVFLSPYVTHRHPSYWENPEGFDPDRFAGGALARMPRFAYFPFGGGARQCIGSSFAMVEGTLVLATILRRVRLDLVPGQTITPEPGITLRPRGGIRMRVVPEPLPA